MVGSVSGTGDKTCSCGNPYNFSATDLGKNTTAYIAKTRPRVLRLYLGVLYLFVVSSLLLVGVGALYGPAANLEMFIKYVEWLGGWIFSVFILSYGVYTGARSLDKRNPNLKGREDLLGTILGAIL